MTANYERNRLTLTFREDETRDLIGVLSYFEECAENPFRRIFAGELKAKVVSVLARNMDAGTEAA